MWCTAAGYSGKPPTLNSKVYSSDTTVAFLSLANKAKCNGPVMSLCHGDITLPPISHHQNHHKQVAVVYLDHRMAGTTHGCGPGHPWSQYRLCSSLCECCKTDATNCCQMPHHQLLHRLSAIASSQEVNIKHFYSQNSIIMNSKVEDVKDLNNCLWWWQQVYVK